MAFTVNKWYNRVIPTQRCIMKKKISRTRIIALGFILMILVGSLLLMLPAASADGQSADPVTALFTATSASCVTGLIARDTATGWSLFGQAVIIVLIQIGGLGFVTVATMFSMLLRRKMGLQEREIMTQSISVDHIGGILTLTKKIIAGTALFEGAGTVLLALRFVPRFGWAKGLRFAAFHAISAFCNAGFDLMGYDTPYSSFTAYADDPLVILTLSALITVGGIGFLVWDDLYKNKFRFKRYKLHTKLVLTVSAVLTFGGTLLFLIFEHSATGKDFGFGGEFLAALFDSVTARTAGFNSVDTASLSNASKTLTVFLMFVGGSPGSTAGGMKTTTLAVLAVCSFNGIRRRESKGIFGRRLEKDAIYNACSVVFVNFSLAFTGILLIAALQPGFALSDVIFEAVSAIGTVGMTTGITRELLPVCKLIIALLMYCGRVGSVSFALALLEKRAAPLVKNPRESISIG